MEQQQGYTRYGDMELRWVVPFVTSLVPYHFPSITVFLTEDEAGNRYANMHGERRPVDEAMHAFLPSKIPSILKDSNSSYIQLTEHISNPYIGYAVRLLEPRENCPVAQQALEWDRLNYMQCLKYQIDQSLGFDKERETKEGKLYIQLMNFYTDLSGIENEEELKRKLNHDYNNAELDPQKKQNRSEIIEKRIKHYYCLPIFKCFSLQRMYLLWELCLKNNYIQYVSKQEEDGFRNWARNLIQRNRDAIARNI